MLFGCASQQTVACETACEIVLIKRQSLDLVLETFPVLESEIQKVQKDEKYKDRILQAIRLRNVSYSEEEK